MKDVLRRLRHGLRKPPGYIVYRIVEEAKHEAERYRGSRRARRFNLDALLAATKARSLSELWNRIREQQYVAKTSCVNRKEYEDICPGGSDRIFAAAAAAVEHRVNLLGSGELELGAEIDWHRDYKTNLSWPREYRRSIDYSDLERPSDVKFPWEVSRMQWLIPAGQAYLLTGDERYPTCARGIIEQWITSNPYGYGVNWGCTMEVALRIIAWTWFFHVFANSRSWADPEFQQTFLTSLYLHASFAIRHLEKSDINGNHYTANAAGLVFAGLFFGQGADVQRWQLAGWQILCDELPRQVFADGVDFEGSVPYHRLVLELFLLPALYRKTVGLEIPEMYRERIQRMGKFTAAYSRPDGSIPLWGDADDGRVLPFGGQGINDHRYLLALLSATIAPELKPYVCGGGEEVFWLVGAQAARSLPSSPTRELGSTAFREGGFYVMRSARDHVFIDCGPVGLDGRGGHGHNDLLSFEAVVDGVHLITDCGAYVYTADHKARNLFRSTASHNTPLVNGNEINRMVPNHLWILRDDARPELRKWEMSADEDVFCGSHSGYQRLAPRARPVRTIRLDKRTHSLTVLDEFEGEARRVETPLHLAPGVDVEVQYDGCVKLSVSRETFVLSWQDPIAWKLSVENSQFSPSYGVVMKAKKLVWTSKLNKPNSLLVKLERAR